MSIINTAILIPEGTKTIEEFTIGEEVISYDVKTKTFVTNHITGIRQAKVKKTITVILANQDEIEGTEEHPFFQVESQKYIKMKDLAVGDTLLSSDGKKIEIKAIKHNQYQNKVKVYTLGVKKPSPNYFAAHVLVHNKDPVFPDLNFPNIDWTDRDLSRLNFSYANLSNANLFNANLSHAGLNDANLISANLISANLYSVYLYRANLLDANLLNANLSRAKLFRANLSNANLSYANLSQTTLHNTRTNGIITNGAVGITSNTFLGAVP